ncbi:hypothetical protein [Muribaculum intestinale]|uniref:hypothetical protein n=1 Tax=Muribaculum intestinale TaxID=1796646 RepID=UPI00242F92A7|nr:hypothetical protein [Muribaculum intestinale]
MKYLYVFTAGTVGRGIVGCVVVRMYSGVPGVAGLRRACRGDTANPTLRTAMAALGWG